MTSQSRITASYISLVTEKRLCEQNDSHYVTFRDVFEETIGFNVKASFASRPVSRLIRWYNKPDDITKEFWEKVIQFHGTFHGLKMTNWENICKSQNFEVVFRGGLDRISIFRGDCWEREGWPFSGRGAAIFT